MSTTSPKPSLVTKLCEVMKEVGRIQKNGRNEFHQYDYVMEADLVDKVRPLLAERNVMVFTSLVSSSRSMNQCKAENKKSYLTDVVMRFTFKDGDTGEEFPVEFPGCGEDGADKGGYKAITGAEKYFLMKSFLIATGDDPENDGNSTNGHAATPKDEGPKPREYKLKSQERPPDDVADEVKHKSVTTVLKEEGDRQTWRTVVGPLERKTGISKKGKPYTLFIVQLAGGYSASTFDDKIANAAAFLLGRPAIVTVEPGYKDGWDLVGIGPDEGTAQAQIQLPEDDDEPSEIPF